MVSGRARLLCGLFLGLHVARARPRDLPADLGHPGVPLHDARIRPRRPRGLCPGLLVGALCRDRARATQARSEEHTSELQSLMRISYAVFCLKKKKKTQQKNKI